MRITGVRGLGIVGAMLIGALVLAPSASATLVKLPNGHYTSEALHAGISPASVPGSIAASRAASGAPPGLSGSSGLLDYHSGAVLHSSSPYLIFWTPSGETISATTESLMQRWFTDIAADSGMSSNVWGVDRQFTDNAGFADYRQTFSSSQTLVDTQSYPSRDASICTNSHVGASDPTCVTDAQLKTEVQRLISTNGLPTDGPTAASELNANAPIYFVVLPLDVNLCQTSTACADNRFCAYHGSMTDAADYVLYSAIPLLPMPALGGRNCQFDQNNTTVEEPNGDLADLALKATSHEESETITDPIVGQGWWDNSSGNEDGDNCNFGGAFDPHSGFNPNAFTPVLGATGGTGTDYNQLINSHPYYIQSEWSNGDLNCEMRPSPGTITAGLAPSSSATPVGTPVTLTPTGSSTHGYSSVTVDFGDGTTSFNHSGSLPASLPHAYSHAGVYTAKITAVDAEGNIAQGTSGQFAVGSPPSASFTFSPSSAPNGVKVSFDGSGSTDPDSGVTLASFTYNFGEGSTGTGANAAHTYSKPGTYNITLAVVNSLGLMSITSHSITIVQAKITHAKVTHKTRKGATIVVKVNAPGKLSGVGKSKSVSGPGTYKLKFKLSKAQLHKLARRGHLTVKLKLKFTPLAGNAFTQKIKLKF